MSFLAEKAAAVRWLNAVGEHIPDPYKPDLASEWERLEDELEKCRSDGSRELCVLEWRQQVGARLAQRLAHCPLPRGLNVATGGLRKPTVTNTPWARRPRNAAAG